MKLITLTSSYKTEWESLISEFEENGEKLIPLAMKGHANTFEEFLIEAYKNSKGIDLPDGIVPSDIYFLVDDNSKYLIGAIDIRHYLNEYLLKYGGNIGYGIRPSERKKGYATEMLYLALEECKTKGLSKVLITCFKSNVASANTIIKNGGILENEIAESGNVKQRYWIQL
ncbi:GNAT family N-acetyltransferase [Clostridium botulinum]|uniref:GNAT family N-acetyltransferase n=1 Tax=unclassified Clostridium TaxID=2614128 RepID=UPI00050058A2|nr:MULTISPECIES: GNAT family N-acetyltransferase [unclassified Clostridium]AIY79902.1 acetyltransferase family protein [Clostridium botulinum 202F]KAI3346018.1 GNAT family N-acetyltransferase [Clostridium botulinum]KFX55382.1 GNAT family acetyltransferase [Clostridium botulinum]KFX55965.1 GNAT family acetyltransferase [Clostridium botulinum]KON13417.1 GNAT family acetyltransferase [Clostridium botulinum]